MRTRVSLQKKGSFFPSLPNPREFLVFKTIRVERIVSINFRRKFRSCRTDVTCRGEIVARTRGTIIHVRWWGKKGESGKRYVRTSISRTLDL